MVFLLLKMWCTLRSQSKILMLSTKNNCLNYKILYIQIEKCFRKCSTKFLKFQGQIFSRVNRLLSSKGEHQFIWAERLNLYLPILKVRQTLIFIPARDNMMVLVITVFFPGVINLTSTLSLYKNEISKKFIQQLNFIKI